MDNPTLRDAFNIVAMAASGFQALQRLSDDDDVIALLYVLNQQLDTGLFLMDNIIPEK